MKNQSRQIIEALTPVKEQDQQMMDCPDCEGTGKMDGKKCDTCNGTGEVPAEDNGGE